MQDYRWDEKVPRRGVNESLSPNIYVALIPGQANGHCGVMVQLETYGFSDDGRFPNSRWPLLVYRNALRASADAMELRFQERGWSNAWRNGLFGYHHFHSNVHEVLGIAAGEADIEFGGPGGQAIEVRPGDVMVIPAGVAHRNMAQTSDLLVVGAYPGGVRYDVWHGDPGEHALVVRNIAAVGVPELDPVFGSVGPMHRLWVTG